MNSGRSGVKVWRDTRWEKSEGIEKKNMVTAEQIELKQKKKKIQPKSRYQVIKKAKKEGESKERRRIWNPSSHKVNNTNDEW